jgi:hypothetical protein
LIAEGMLERVEDFVHHGIPIPASRLGYRITTRFVRTYLARVFDNPGKVFSEEILKPEKQDLDAFADGILHIAEVQQRVAQRYLEDGGYELACPPLRAVISILATGAYDGKTIGAPEVRRLFTREHLLSSEWYRRRLAEQQDRDIQHWKDATERLEQYIDSLDGGRGMVAVDLDERLQYAQRRFAEAQHSGYVDSLVGTLGADPMRVSANDPLLIDRLANV